MAKIALHSLTRFFFIIGTILTSFLSQAQTLDPSPDFYRDFALRVRNNGDFKIPMPSHGDLHFSYKLNLGRPVFEKPIIRDYVIDQDSGRTFRVFFDKIFLADDSYLELSGEQVPLTCIFIRGQDHRLAKETPLLPDILLQVYLVANDYSCTGPINPGWPENGGKKELWDTYLRFDVRDPTIMLPVEAVLRYRWNEYSAILQDAGEKTP